MRKTAFSWIPAEVRSFTHLFKGRRHVARVSAGSVGSPGRQHRSRGTDTQTAASHVNTTRAGAPPKAMRVLPR